MSFGATNGARSAATDSPGSADPAGGVVAGADSGRSAESAAPEAAAPEDAVLDAGRPPRAAVPDVRGDDAFPFAAGFPVAPAVLPVAGLRDPALRGEAERLPERLGGRLAGVFPDSGSSAFSTVPTYQVPSEPRRVLTPVITNAQHPRDSRVSFRCAQ